MGKRKKKYLTDEERERLREAYRLRQASGPVSEVAVAGIAADFGVSTAQVYKHTRDFRQRGTANEEAKRLAAAAATPPTARAKGLGRRPPGSEIQEIIARLITTLERLDITEIHVNVEKREAEIKRQPTKKIKLGANDGG